MSFSPVSCHSDKEKNLIESKYIGISDPISDTIVALTQAVQRALAFYALNQNMEISSVYEYYYIDDDIDVHCNNKKSHWIADFESKLENYSYSIEKILYTKYNEIVVLINVTDDASADNELSIAGSFMYHYDYMNRKVEYGEKQLLLISCPEMINSLKWISLIDKNITQKGTSVNDNLYRLKNMVNIYEDYGTVDDNMVFSDIRYGLWNSYIDNFFQAVSNFEPTNIVLKNSTRHISLETDGDFGEKSQDIIRRVIKTKVSCSLMSLSLKNNKLYANWEIIER
ncbi:MAG: hypothetical protein IKD32_00775 [Bacteroidales bacterium]|nr:hypothetical protein [Bacteroidales bacterium]